jgi:4-alpha-glucanotransferase
MVADALSRLAALAGIEEGWWDFFGHYRIVPDETKRVFLASMGFAVATRGEVAASLVEFDARPWRRWLPPVHVASEIDGPPEIAVTVADPDEDNLVEWVVSEDNGAVHRGSLRPRQLPVAEQRVVDGYLRRRHIFRLPGTPLPGIHSMRLATPSEDLAETTLIVAPARAYLPRPLGADGRLWGYATQLYALRSESNWGIGDFTDLANLARRAAGQGASAIGINPLHALFASQPDRFSPYSPSSRLYLNVIHIDIEAVPDFATATEARRLFASPGFQTRLGVAQNAKLVDYPTVLALKVAALEACWKAFRAQHLATASPRGEAYWAFRRAGGQDLERYAVFEALQADFMARDPAKAYWRLWPAEYRNPKSPAVAAFASSNRGRVDFYIYLQWLADEQLAGVQSAARQAGMPIGIYRDLGVGIAGDGGEAWANQDLLCLGVSVGAPPDPLNLAGQDWGLVPFNPITLREAAYRPLLAVLEANMTHAGAMRLDHAMSLQRLYWVPNGAPADQGAYLRHPLADQLAVTVLASHRKRCLVIGEDLGTVPEGFRERTQARGVLGYRLMVFEKSADGYKTPADYPAQALVAFGTHDLPSLAGWWQGIDIKSRERLKLYKDPALGVEESAQRTADRLAIRRVLVAEGLLDEDFPETPTLNNELRERLTRAIYAFLDRTPAKLLMVQFEDVLGIPLQMNLPGTTTQHPNWRVRYPIDGDAMLGDPRLARLAELLADRSARVDNAGD